jgi:hypothetical protein
MSKNVVFWVLAFVITCGSAVFQRMTGPSYPCRGEVIFENQVINYKFDRSHEGNNNHKVILSVTDKDINGTLIYKRYKSNDSITYVKMTREGTNLYAEFPGQPPSGKVQYQVMISKGNSNVTIPDKSVILRFKSSTPLIYLIPHIIIMFAAMLFSIKAGIDCFRKDAKLKMLTYWTLILFFFGGFVLGPIVQYYAFGSYWSGFPFGMDMTDNKTLLALIAWIAAFIAIKRGKAVKIWVLTASIILFLVYMIPHSVLGSEIDYSKQEKTQIINHK